MKKNKIVITGGAGFVGTNLIKLLLKKKLDTSPTFTMDLINSPSKKSILSTD